MVPICCSLSTRNLLHAAMFCKHLFYAQQGRNVSCFCRNCDSESVIELQDLEKPGRRLVPCLHMERGSFCKDMVCEPRRLAWLLIGQGVCQAGVLSRDQAASPEQLGHGLVAGAAIRPPGSTEAQHLPPAGVLQGVTRVKNPLLVGRPHTPLSQRFEASIRAAVRMVRQPY